VVDYIGDSGCIGRSSFVEGADDGERNVNVLAHGIQHTEQGVDALVTV
jgi:hypothetical protein